MDIVCTHSNTRSSHVPDCILRSCTIDSHCRNRRNNSLKASDTARNSSHKEKILDFSVEILSPCHPDDVIKVDRPPPERSVNLSWCGRRDLNPHVYGWTQAPQACLSTGSSTPAFQDAKVIIAESPDLSTIYFTCLRRAGGSVDDIPELAPVVIVPGRLEEHVDVVKVGAGRNVAAGGEDKVVVLVAGVQ